jgi:DnaJ family protein A protein 5
MPNVWPYFSVSCFAGFAPGRPDNFYAVYQRAFEEVWAAEPSARREQASPPPFGAADAPWKVARDFYAFWSSFVSEGTFAWADKWRTPDGESRDVRRQMKK